MEREEEHRENERERESSLHFVKAAKRNEFQDQPANK